MAPPVSIKLIALQGGANFSEKKVFSRRADTTGTDLLEFQGGTNVLRRECSLGVQTPYNPKP